MEPGLTAPRGKRSAECLVQSRDIVVNFAAIKWDFKSLKSRFGFRFSEKFCEFGSPEVNASITLLCYDHTDVSNFKKASG